MMMMMILKYLENGERYDVGLNGRPIGKQPWAINWQRQIWFWVKSQGSWTAVPRCTLLPYVCSLFCICMWQVYKFNWIILFMLCNYVLTGSWKKIVIFGRLIILIHWHWNSHMHLWCCCTLAKLLNGSRCHLLWRWLWCDIRWGPFPGRMGQTSG